MSYDWRERGERPFSKESIVAEINSLFPGHEREGVGAYYWQHGYSIADVQRIATKLQGPKRELRGYPVVVDGKLYWVYRRSYPNASRDFVHVYDERGRSLYDAKGNEAIVINQEIHAHRLTTEQFIRGGIEARERAERQSAMKE